MVRLNEFAFARCDRGWAFAEDFLRGRPVRGQDFRPHKSYVDIRESSIGESRGPRSIGANDRACGAEPGGRDEACAKSPSRIHFVGGLSAAPRLRRVTF